MCVYIHIIHTIYVKSYYHIIIYIYIVVSIGEICLEKLAHTVMEADKSQKLQGKSASWRPQES